MVKMLLTCRCTVRSLRKSSAAMALVAASRGDEAKDLELPSGEVVAGSRCRVQRLEARQIRGAQLREHPARAVELQARGVLVTQLPARDRQQHAGTARLVWRGEVIPRLHRPSQRLQRGARVSVDQLDRAPRLSRQGPEHARPVAGGDLLELGARTACLLHVPRHEHDFHAGRQQRRAARSLCRLRQGAVDCGGRCVSLPLGKPQQREPGLRLPAEPTRVAVRRLGSGEVPLHAEDFACDVCRLARSPAVAAGEAARERSLSLLDGLAPVAVELEDLRAMHQAAAAERNKVGLAFAPPRQRRRPLPRPTQLVRILAGEDHAAVDDAAHDRRQLAACHRYHRLVEQAQPLFDAVELDEQMPLGVHGEREQVAVAEALPVRRRLGRELHRLVVRPHALPLEHDGDQQIAPLDTLASVTLDEPLRPAEPAAGLPHLAYVEEVHAEPERRPCSGQESTRVQMLAMDSLADRRVLVVPAEHVGRRRQEVEVLNGEGRRRVRLREQAVGLLPRPPRVAHAASLEMVPHVREYLRLQQA